ncbi:hypothetical protein FHS85_002970 [Rhodoligotrophos appendicifer]|uniref:DnaJ domain-containing protein n=1 Tax=Rhodoligotrophos appendicifer TaxID=987056 RepID=UPI001185A41C|nr:DnaJ domain-containing protein [Rhodoligotrophos appendicifer]
MQVLFIIGLVLLCGYFLSRNYVKADPKRLAKLVRGGAGAVIALFGTILSLRGGIAFGAPLIAFGLGMLGREMNLVSKGPGGFSRAGTRAPGQRSTVRTSRLAMELDHDTGAMDGKVLGGRFADRQLSALTLSDLQQLLTECAAIPDQSRVLLEAYLDRMRDGWREATGRGPASPPSSSAMSREEAFRILELETGASERDVKNAHRRLMKKFHPDAGGSVAFAAMINQAKDVLLGKR